MSMSPRGFARFVFVCLFGWFSCSAAADLYKCQLADGSVLYSDTSCADDSIKPLVLHENMALDSAAERENIAQYNSSEARWQREAHRQRPQILLIPDGATAERNARITQESRKPKKKHTKKQKKKVKKKKPSKNPGKQDKKAVTSKT